MPEILKVTTVGDKALLARLNSLGKAGVQAGRRVLFQKAEKIAGDAKQQCPVDTGALKSTIHVEMSDASQAVSASVVCGGPAASYAVYVHEDLTARHTNGNAKFIERPFLQELPKIAPALVAALNKVAK